MRRYETKIDDGILYVESPEGGWLSIGAMSDIYELVGGQEYEIEYDERHAAYFDWLSTDRDGIMTIDVREALAGMSYPGTFVEQLAARDEEAPTPGSPPERTTYFADVMTDVWAQKGNIDDDENPFL